MANRLALAFEILARDKASRPVEHVGDTVARTGEKVERGSGRAGKAFGLLGKTFASSSAGALGPLQELTDKFDLFTQATEQGGSKVGGRLLGLGLAATAAGGFIESLHSKEQGALQQLQASIETTGQSYDTYREDVEKAIQSGERFGNTAGTTADALNRLVTTTHNPAEAFKDLSVAIDVAAEKHITLAKAAELVGLTFNGSTRAGKQFGLHLVDVAGAAKALTAAQHGSVAAVTAVKNAQTTYTEKLAEWNASSKHTLTQAYALRDAHTKLLEAQDKASAAAARLKTAQEKASAAHHAGARNVAQLAGVVKGQGSAAADTFTGHLKAMGAQIEDTLGAHGKLGGSLVTVGALGSGLGALIQAGVFGKIGGGLTTLATKFGILRDVEVATSAEGAAAIVTNSAVADAAMVAEGDVAVATASRIRLAMAGAATGVGLLVVALSNVKFDPKEKFGALLDDPDKRKLLGLPDVPVTGSNNPDDLRSEYRADHLAQVLASTKPSHATAGKDNGDAYLKGLLDQIGGDQAASKAHDAAVKTAQSIVDAIGNTFQAASSRLQSIVSASLNLRQSVTSALQGGSALTDIFNGPDLNANGAFGRQNNFGRIQSFLQKRVALDRKFVLDLRALIKQGLDPSLVAQIAQAGPDAGLRIAEGILSGGKGGIGQVNSLERQIASLANTTGKSVADQHYAQQIAEQRRTTEVLGHQLQVANARLAAIQNNTRGGTDPNRDGLSGVG